MPDDGLTLVDAPSNASFPGAGEEWTLGSAPTREPDPADDATSDAAAADGTTPAAPSAASLAELTAKVDGMLAALQVPRETRTLATPPQPAVDARTLANALAEANAQQRRQWEAERAAAAAFTPPQWSEDDKAKVIADPDALYAKVSELAAHYARAGYAQAMSQLAPAARTAEIAHQLWMGSIDAQAEYAYDRARSLAQGMGMAPADIDEVQEHAYSIMREAANQTADPDLHFSKMALQPKAVLAALQMARARVSGGPPIANKAKPAPTIGTGTHREKSAPPARPPIVSQMERVFGKKFTDAQLKAAAERGKLYDAQM